MAKLNTKYLEQAMREEREMLRQGRGVDGGIAVSKTAGPSSSLGAPAISAGDITILGLCVSGSIYDDGTGDLVIDFESRNAAAGRMVISVRENYWEIEPGHTPEVVEAVLQALGRGQGR
jgi:hypothetical protein